MKMPLKWSQKNEREDRLAVRLSEQPTIAPDASIIDCTLGRYTEIAEGAKLKETKLGDYSYAMERADIIYTDIGKFVNIASEVRINPGNHPTEWVSQHHFLYRMSRYRLANQDDETFFGWCRFPTAIWQKLEAIAWWDWEHEILAERLEDFRDIRRFISLYGREK